MEKKSHEEDAIEKLVHMLLVKGGTMGILQGLFVIQSHLHPSALPVLIHGNLALLI